MATTTMTTELDFDQIKANLVAFMRSQEEFTDYDFEGSGITQILNVLALNTHYNAFLANASFNESFLDTAIKRANVVSRAKEIGYTARSARSAAAIIDIDVLSPTNTPVSLSLDKYSAFTTSISGSDYTFYTIDAVTAPMADGQYEFASVPVYEGTLVTNSFVYAGGRPYFTIPNADVDLRTLSVIVQTSSTDTYREKFNFTDELVGVTATSPVFFVQENAQEKYEVYFGDGAIGRALVAGNVVQITYLVSSKDAANVSSSKFAQTFSYAGDIGGNSNIVVRTVSNSVGGAEKEDATSMKFNAPLSLARAKRIITADDYLSAIGDGAASVEAVSVWGGEDHDPPTYGKVFISLKPYDGYVISEQVKSDIQTGILNKQGNRLVTAVFMDPEYIYLTVDVQATYNSDKTTVSSDDIKGYITTNIQNYFANELSKYKRKFYFSKLQRLIDDTNDSLVGNILTLNLQKRVTFPFNYPTTIDVNYAVALKPGSLTTNIFTYSPDSDRQNMQCTFVDDGLGYISVRDSVTLQIVAPNVGTVNYTTGKIVVKDFVITGLIGDVEDIRLNFAPLKAVTDIETNRNQIILLDDSTKIAAANVDSGLKVNVVAE